MKKLFSENSSVEAIAAKNLVIGWIGGFALGFVTGAAIIAIIDYRDEKRKESEKLRKDSDTNYYYSTD